MVDIDPSLNVGGEEELELLQDLIKIATNDALSKAKKISDDKLGAVTAGISLPGM
jgi:DNA-binding protein YbaB